MVKLFREWREVVVTPSLKETDLKILIANVQQNLDGDASFKEICRRFAGLVNKYARQAHLTGIWEDALSEGWLAVVVAVKTYDETRQISPVGYIDTRVKYAVWNLFKKERKKWQRQLSTISITKDGEGVDILEYIPASGDIAAHIADKLDLENEMVKIQNAFSKLSLKQQITIKRTIFDNCTLKQLAEDMGISSQAICNYRKRGLKKIRITLNITKQDSTNIR